MSEQRTSEIVETTPTLSWAVLPQDISHWTVVDLRPAQTRKLSVSCNSGGPLPLTLCHICWWSTPDKVMALHEHCAASKISTGQSLLQASDCPLQKHDMTFWHFTSELALANTYAVGSTCSFLNSSFSCLVSSCLLLWFSSSWSCLASSRSSPRRPAQIILQTSTLPQLLYHCTQDRSSNLHPSPAQFLSCS